MHITDVHGFSIFHICKLKSLTAYKVGMTHFILRLERTSYQKQEEMTQDAINHLLTYKKHEHYSINPLEDIKNLSYHKAGTN